LRCVGPKLDGGGECRKGGFRGRYSRDQERPGKRCPIGGNTDTSVQPWKSETLLGKKSSNLAKLTVTGKIGNKGVLGSVQSIIEGFLKKAGLEKEEREKKV